MRNEPTSGPAAGRPGAGKVFLLLAALNVLSAGASIALTRELVVSFRSSLEANAVWTARGDSFARLVRLAGEANAPGNNVFVSHDAGRERARERAAEVAFEATFAAARADLVATLPPAAAAPIVGELDRARDAFAHMAATAALLFDAAERGDARAAAGHMARMDQDFALVREAIDGARVAAAETRAGLSRGATREAERKNRNQYAVAAVVLLAVAAASAYGMRLARAVARGQAELSRRNDAMRLVFDHVGQGFLSVDPRGVLAEERSRVVAEWFGEGRPGETLAALFARADADAAAWLEVSLDQVFQDVLPLEAALDQLPKRVVARGGRPLGVGYQPVLAGGAIARVLVVLSDLTQEEERARAEEEQRLAMALYEAVTQDREGFTAFFSEATRSVDALCSGRLRREEAMRALHTLKGNCGVFGLRALAVLFHELEGRVVEGGGPVSAEQRALLAERWRALSDKAARLLGRRRPRLDVAPDEYEALLRAAAAGAPRDELVARLEGWKNESAVGRLDRLAEHARELGRRLGRSPVEVRVEAPEPRLPAGDWHSFFSSLVHLVRNAIDHGVETPEERAAAGKPPRAELVLRAAREGGAFVVEVSDDGRGIDWDAVARKARSLDLPASSPDDLVEALFADGVSTQTEVTIISGRGVGLASVKLACLVRGGANSVRSEGGRGTTVTCRFPARAAGLARAS